MGRSHFKFAQPLFVLHDRNYEIKEIMIDLLILSKNSVRLRPF